MSHVDDASHDFEGLEGLPFDVAQSVKEARMEARDIIDELEPRHIRGWKHLIGILEKVLEDIEYQQWLANFVSPEELRRTP